MKIVVSYGALYRVTDAAHRLILNEIAQGRHPSPAVLGKHLGVIDTDITDMTAEDAAARLEWNAKAPSAMRGAQLRGRQAK